MMNTRNQQTGAMLLEALVSILIFSIGILAIIGLQAAAVRASSDAKYRSEAGLLTNQLIGQMQAGDRAVAATLQTNFQGGTGCGAAGAAYTAWVVDVAATLPGVTGVPANQPTVCIAAGATTGNVATITVFWLLPGDTGAAHQYRTIVPII